MVSTAKGTGRGMALEDLRISAAGVNGSKRQRRVLHTLELLPTAAFIAYKAALAGVRVVYVNPAYTSQTCSACGHCEKANRTSQSKFLCTSCGFSAHADVNAAVNIRQPVGPQSIGQTRRPSRASCKLPALAGGC